MKKNFLLITILITITALSFGCNSKNSSNESSSGEGKMISVSAEKAKEMMDSSSGYIILDVRRPDEYEAGHVKGAILLPDYEIIDKAESVLTDKNQQIFVYCRSGRRSKGAAKNLVQLGYTNIVEFGGIINWPYEIEK